MSRPYSVVVGEKLLKLRKQLKLTQDDVAKALDMSRTSFSKYENGISAPPLPVMKKLAEFYNVGLEYLLFDDNTVARLNDPVDDENGSGDCFDRITELKPVEREIILKYRTLPEAEKKEIYKRLFPSEPRDY